MDHQTRCLMKQLLRVSLFGIAIAFGGWFGPVAAVPGWLGGEADLEQRPDRCGVYKWFFEQADAQTEGLASENELAGKRLINLVNKLVAHHQQEGEDSYSAEIRYLVIGEEEPHHFSFRITGERLDALLACNCEQAQ